MLLPCAQHLCINCSCHWTRTTVDQHQVDGAILMNTFMFVFKVFPCSQVQKPHDLIYLIYSRIISNKLKCSNRASTGLFYALYWKKVLPTNPLDRLQSSILQMALQIRTSVPMSVVVWVWSSLVLSIVWKMFQHAYHSLYWSLQKLISCVSFSYHPSCLNQYMLVCISDVAWLWTWSSFGLVFHK